MLFGVYAVTSCSFCFHRFAGPNQCWLHVFNLLKCRVPWLEPPAPLQDKSLFSKLLTLCHDIGQAAAAAPQLTESLGDSDTDVRKSAARALDAIFQKMPALAVQGIGHIYLANRGATSCPEGSTGFFDYRSCQEAAKVIHTRHHRERTRRLQEGSGGGCGGHDRGWGAVPIGCSVQSRGDWTAHLKLSGSNCPDPRYQLVCRRGLDVKIYLAARGAKSCPRGTSPNDKHSCQAAAAFIYAQNGQGSWRSLAVGSLTVGSGGGCVGYNRGWGGVPIGCSVQSGGDWAAHLKLSGPNCPDPIYQLVCVEDCRIDTFEPHKKCRERP